MAVTKAMHPRLSVGPPVELAWHVLGCRSGCIPTGGLASAAMAHSWQEMVFCDSLCPLRPLHGAVGCSYGDSQRCVAGQELCLAAG
jgi:hypothetical protein